MNARAEALVEEKIEYIPLSAICPSETEVQRLRRKRYSMDSLADLRMSIAKSGVQSPVVVRKLAALRGLASYELAFGERRWRAAGQAGLAHLPAVVRVLSDADVLEVQLIENLQREELHPLEEAAGYTEYMKVAKLKPEDLGERVGKSRSWVYSRLNLLKLDGEARTALENGRLDVSRALVVASIAQPNQRARVLEMALELGSNEKPVYSVRELRAEAVKDLLIMPLLGAPFDPADATLAPLRGACGGCPFRTGNCDPEALNPDVCTDVVCFHAKVKETATRKRAALLAAGGKVLKGDEARKISPSIKTVYGHVDLDLVCEADDFPEPEPKAPKGVDSWSAEWEANPAYIAWREKEKLWQPRTYRQLLEGCKFTPVLIDDPKSKALRELIPFKEAQKLLKQKGFDLPSHYNRQRPTHHGAGARGSSEDREKAERRHQTEQARKEAERAVELLVRARVLKEAWPKLKATLDKDVLVKIANEAGNTDDLMQCLFGHEDLRKLKEADLVKVIVYGSAGQAVGNFYWQREAKALYEIATKAKVNVGAIRKQVAKEQAAATTKGDSK